MNQSAAARSANYATGDSDRAVLRVEDLTVYYDTPDGNVKAAEGVSFSLKPGERLAIVGESGSGKTTVATALLRLTRPPGRIVRGSVYIGDQDVVAMEEQAVRRMRLSEIALIPQGAMNSLNPVLRVGSQIQDGIMAHRRITQQEVDEQISGLLKTVGLQPSVAGLFPHELSGGMKQRVAMAIATSLEPRVIVADEPTSALDVVVQRRIMETLGRLQAGLGAAVVLIGHDMGLVAQFADYVGVMYAGRLVDLGPVEDVFDNPLHPYTKLLINSLPNLERRSAELAGIPGLPPALLNPPSGCAFHPRCPYLFDPCPDETPEYLEAVPGRHVACHLYPGRDRLPEQTRRSMAEIESDAANAALSGGYGS